MSRDSRVFYALLLLALVVFGANIGGYDLWPPDEPRFTEVAREMVESGDYLVPRVNGEVYQEKPPLLFWLIALSSTPFGDVNEWAARIPSVLCAVYVVALTFALASRLFTTQVALWSALILMSCFQFWWQARRGQIDMVLTAGMMTTLYAFWRWDDERHKKWRFLAYAGIAAGLLAKGPPALVFPGLFLVAYYWGNREGRAATRWVWGFAAAIVVALLWFVPARLLGADSAAQAVESGMGANLFRNTIGRALMGVSKAQPPWYYLKTLPVGLLPWTFICPPVLYWAWKNRKDSQAMRFLWAWIGPALIFFSVVIGKRELYLLPLFPVFAILFGAALVHLREKENFTWLRRGGIVWSILLILMGFSPLVLSHIPYVLESNTHLDIVAAVAFFAGNLGLLHIRKSGSRVV
ncbi:MAG: glycosyltransferase family 39 protein, partial [Candidatus Hydrogenedentes bacterium]|nr:glycosyltransferase family 39 protein [Candidatus Hydrogenedentota bacterium]